MAKSAYEYVKYFEETTTCLYNTYIVIRLDGKCFSNFTKKFTKPNDIRGIHLMNDCAKAVMKEFTDIILAYGQSDEYSFIFHPHTTVYNRKRDKILSIVTSIFSSHFVFAWNQFLYDLKLEHPLPSFDGRIMSIPTLRNLRDYLSWRQVDCRY